MRIKLFGRVITIRASGAREERLPLVGEDGAWARYLSGRGMELTPMVALRVAAVFRCVDVICKTMSSLPLHMIEQVGEDKRKAREHRLYQLLYVQPNRYTTAYEMWQMFVANLLLTRGAFLRIERDRRGYIVALWNVPTACVSDIQVNRVSGERFVIVSDAERGVQETLREGDFLYAPGFRFSSDKDPEHPLAIAADVLGLTRDTHRYAQSSFSGVNPGGFIEHPQQLSDEAYERFMRSFTESYAGVQNAGRWLFVEEGAVAKPFTRDMERSQVLESRKWAVSEVCRLFGVPAHLCMDMEHATFSNIEQQSLEYVRDCINPLCVRIEQILHRDLLREDERGRYYFKFNLDGLLRGDTASRTAYYNSMRQNGIMSANEIRAKEDMNRLPGDAGDTVFINGNMLPLDNARLNLPRSAQTKGAG